MRLPGHRGGLFYLERIPGEPPTRVVDRAVERTLTFVYVDVYVEDWRALGNHGPYQVRHAQELRAVVDVLLQAANAGNEQVVALIRQVDNVPAVDLGRQ